MFPLISTLLFFTQAGATPVPQGFTVNFSASHIHGLVEFSRAISGEANFSRSLTRAFAQWPGHDAPEVKRAVESLQKLAPLFQKGVNFPSEEVLFANEPGWSLADRFTSLAVEVKTLEELARFSRGLFPPREQQELMAALKALLPIYDKFIWSGKQQAITRQTGALKTSFSTWDGPRILQNAVRLYDSQWPAAHPFSVAIHPLPGHNGHSNARNYGPLQSVTSFTDAADLPGRYGVIIHEICHSLIDLMAPETRKRVEAEFLRAPESRGLLPALYLNEGLATAIGNGIATTRALGKPDPTSWYDDPTIERYAHALVPLVEGSFAAGTPMDESFARKAAEAFHNANPSAAKDLSVLAIKSILISDGKLPLHEIKRELRRHLRVASLSSSAPAHAPETAEDAGRLAGAVFIAVSPENTTQLSALAQTIPEVSTLVQRLEVQPRVAAVAMLDKNGRAIVLLKPNVSFDKSFEAIKRSSMLDGLTLIPEVQ